MICPACKNCRVEGKIGSRECPACGCFETENLNNNIMWMKDGEVIQCLVEEEAAEAIAQEDVDTTARALRYLKKQNID